MRVVFVAGVFMAACIGEPGGRAKGNGSPDAGTCGNGTVDDLCVDGNGAQIARRDCATDPRIADAYSIALDINAVGAVPAGRQP